MVFKYTFQHSLDIATSSSSMQIIQVNAGGEYVRERCKHLFNVYKYFKLGRVSVKLLPASTLPVDPLGLSYGSTDPQTVDPRDQMNPGLVRITNGEDIYSSMTGLTDDQQSQIYTNTMLDPRWSKFMLQRGFSRSAIPLYWTVGNLKQTVYPDSFGNLPVNDGSGKLVNTDCIIDSVDSSGNLARVLNPNVSTAHGLFQTGKRGRLDWLPSDAFQTYTSKASDGSPTANEQAILAPIPEINLITLVLPKAYKTLFYYRMFITETVYFKGVKNVGIGLESAGSISEYRAIDNFTFCDYPKPCKPSESRVNDYVYPHIPNDGGA